MVAVNGYTAAYMETLSDANITDARLDTYNLILIQRDLTEIDVGNVRGATGPQGPSTNIFNPQADDYTLVLSDNLKCIKMTKATPTTLSIPENSTVAFAIGDIVQGVQHGAGLVTIAPVGGVVLRSRGGLLDSAGQYARWKMEKVGTDEWYVSGDLA